MRVNHQHETNNLASNSGLFGCALSAQNCAPISPEKNAKLHTQLKLQHIQFNVVNADTLREAQLRPQDFAGLVVRVAGYSAFFVELSKEIQDDIIRRTAHQL